MDTSVLLARFLGSFYLIFGLLFILTRQLGRTIEMTENRAFVVSTGYISLLLGLGVVVLHNLWVWDWRLAITVLGWSTLIKGVLKTGFPDLIHRQAQRFERKQGLSTVLLMLLGAWLFWTSFGQ